MTAGLDTTAGSLGGNTMSQFVDNPDQWAMVRDDPSLIPSAVLEGVRIDSVAQWFTRVTTRDVEIDDILIPEDPASCTPMPRRIGMSATILTRTDLMSDATRATRWPSATAPTPVWAKLSRTWR